MTRPGAVVGHSALTLTRHHDQPAVGEHQHVVGGGVGLQIGERGAQLLVPELAHLLVRAQHAVRLRAQETYGVDGKLVAVVLAKEGRARAQIVQQHVASRGAHAKVQPI